MDSCPKYLVAERTLWKDKNIEPEDTVYLVYTHYYDFIYELKMGFTSDWICEPAERLVSYTLYEKIRFVNNLIFSYGFDSLEPDTDVRSEPILMTDDYSEIKAYIAMVQI